MQGVMKGVMKGVEWQGGGAWPLSKTNPNPHPHPHPNPNPNQGRCLPSTRGGNLTRGGSLGRGSSCANRQSLAEMLYEAGRVADVQTGCVAARGGSQPTATGGSQPTCHVWHEGLDDGWGAQAFRRTMLYLAAVQAG